MTALPLARPNELARDLNIWHATALVVGIIIGSGIFFVPTSMTRAAGSFTLVMLAWIVGGLLSWFGTLAFAELGAMKPAAGGEYVYIRDGYGPMLGFLYAWNTFLIAKPASIAAVAAAMVRNLGQFPTLDFLQAPVFQGWVDISAGQLFAAVVIAGFSLLNYIGVRKAGNFQAVATALKIGVILLIVGIAFSWPRGTTANYSTTYALAPAGFAGFMTALIAALWAYDGWNNLVMVAGEVREPQRNIPRALLLGIAVVGALYIATYCAIQYVLPAAIVAESNRPASLAMEFALGPVGASLLSAGIAFSMFVTLNGQILAGARIPFAAARDRYFFQGLARVHPRFRTPSVSLAFQAALTIVLIIVGGEFENLFNLAIFSEWLFYMLATSTVFIFRMREPNAERPYRMFGYPFVPVLFIAAAAVLLVYSFRDGLRPELLQMSMSDRFSAEGIGYFLRSNSFWGSVIIAAGIPVFLIFQRINKAR